MPSSTQATAANAAESPAAYALLAAGALALFAWLTPTHEIPWTTFHQEVAMAVAALIAGAAVFWYGRGRAASLAVPALVTLGVALVPLAQTAGGLLPFRGDGALACIYLAGFALAQIIGQRAVILWGVDRSLQSLAWIILIGAVTSVWFTLCQWQELEYLGFVLSPLPSFARPYANLNQPNLLATLLVLGLLAITVLHDSGRLGAMTASALLAMLGFGLAMTQSRAGLLELLVVTVLLLTRRRYLTGRTRWAQVLIGFILVSASMAGWQMIRGVAPAAPAARDASTMLELGARGPHWAAMLDAIQRHPWLGYGWGQGSVAQYAVAPEHPAAPGVFDYGHNLVLDLLLWNGIPLGAVIVAALALWFWFAMRGAREPGSVLALACVVAVFTHAMVEFPLYNAIFLLPVGALIGGLSASTLPRAAITVPGALPPLLLAASACALLVVGRDYLRLEADVRSLRYERARIGVDRPRHELSNPLLLTHMGAFTRFARTPEHHGMSDDELNGMVTVTQRFPSGPNIVRYAAALAINERPAQATEALRRVCKMNRPPTCEAMKALWRGLGEREPAIAGIAWPD